MTALRLSQDGPLPIDSQPRQVLKDGGLEMRAASDLVDVLDAEMEPALGLTGGAPGGQGGKGVTAVKITARRRREAGDEA